ncbi:HNH endonuclease [Streptomyces sp. NPDC057877]|uniref:HNH endonuclease n=1 Tax=Streptomyces sp. NPDC057877 TaxID=3346269 RepID=UPI003686E03E
MDGHWKEAASSWRTVPRPTGWKRIRAGILERDGGVCTWIDDGERCTEPGTDVDHIGDPDDHSPANLRLLCGYHHRRRTALQARAARGPLPTRRRPTEAHPGLVSTQARRPRPAGDDVPPF